ncbi:MBL fold metallo-hydrolase [Micrococcaceae bacterium Sec5.1]
MTNLPQRDSAVLGGIASPATQGGPDFSAIRLTRHVTRIYDRLMSVQMYLVEGEDRALRVDTGFGVGELRSFVSALTDQPLSVFVTHGHLGHAFGVGWFDDVYMSHADLGTLSQQTTLLQQVHDEALNEGRILGPPIHSAEMKDIVPGQIFQLGCLTVRAVPFPATARACMHFFSKRNAHSSQGMRQIN